uniref:Transposable element P transposase-like RNase H domain-containing protein n=1 Tax=Glossina pallidipes TaxID=7398 RepID=A0A1B0AD68_GLOPL
MKYPKLWGVSSDWVDWDLAAKQLAANLTEQLGCPITTKNVRLKVKTIKYGLKNLDKLDNSKVTRQTTLEAFLWYALKLGLRNAAGKISKQLICDGKMQESKYSGHLKYFDKTDKVNERWLPHINELIEQTKRIRDIYTREFVTDQEMVDETLEELVMAAGEPTTSSAIQSPANIDYLDIDYEDIDYLDIDYEDVAYLDIEQEHLEQEQVRQETVPDVEALRALVSGLDPLDKVVTLAFDELFTSQETTYLAAEDRLYGCGYDDNGRATPFATVLIFWVRSIFTPFNMLLSIHNFVQNRGGAQDLLEDRINLVEMIGLDLKAVICDRSATNCISLRGFRNGIYYMPEDNIGMKMMTSIRDRVPFFQLNGTCPNGIDHRRHLLSYIIRLALSGENWKEEPIKNFSSFSLQLHN